MQGNDQVAVEDVVEVGKAIGVTLNAVTANRFSVLDRADKGKGKKIASRQAQGGGALGGLLTLWDSTEVEVWASESYEHVLWCHGRFLLYGDWCLTWPNCMQVAQMRGLSDHCPLVDGWGGYVLKEKLKRIKRELKEWHKSHTHNLPSRIESLNVRLATLDKKGEEDTLLEPELAELHEITTDIHSLSRLHTSICWQQSRSRWLKEGDANTKYFHSVLASRRWGNVISSLQVDSTIVEGVVPIREAVVSHFASHFKAVRIDRLGVDNLSFKQLNPMESPGLDGINFGFIKDFWNELKGDIMRFIVEFHRNEKLTKGLNATFIALIPKVDSPQHLTDFRLISLVGTLYKILAKVLANRLRMVLGSVISESQSEFVKGRQILDGILIVNEVVDEAGRVKKDLMLFKVDFEKAYDSVDWGYLDSVMGKMGFPTLWRKWIRECVCTATASVLVNGSPTEEFPFERGLRQGDPLSHFLFLLAAEGLHVLMEALVERNLFTGWANVHSMRAALVLFETMSGLKVNFNKILLVGVNIPDSWLGEAASALSCRVGKIPFLYLGLSIGGDPRRISFWEPVLDRLKSRLSGWQSRFLSFGGRLVLLKSVLTSLPVFWEPVLDRLKSRLSGWQSRFLSFGGRLVLLKSVLTSLPVYVLSFFKAPSGVWGLGVRKLREFNLALLGKWCWRMLVERDSLWFRVLAARYGLERGRLCEGGMRGSMWWRELVRIRDGTGELGGGWFRENIMRKVGDGSDTFFWTDPWLDGTPLRERFGRLFDLAENKSVLVAEMFSLGWGAVGEAWDHTPDSWQWQPGLDSGYTVRGAYQVLTEQVVAPLDGAAGFIWHPQVPLKVSILAWRLLCDSTFGSLWPLVSSWTGSPLVTTQTLPDHFVQFTCSAGGSRARRSFMQLIWLVSVWVVWTERNHRLFRGSANSLSHMLDKIKTFSYRWLRVNSSTIALNCHRWSSSPRPCLTFGVCIVTFV
ncbi:hypothetical protein TSUD_361200 [Trifolium subterraneum]|uniref:Reverse transcriptase domain-containing protein n=1 Tax=Trifolium subterraneum TaxID=3900 RepID=A0A2Z6NNG9_TRISU|nr:hypothetical protein TSUD_361200 [Trifolium subterraneum]